MRELVIVLQRLSCLDQLLQNCADHDDDADHNVPSAFTSKRIFPVGLEKDWRSLSFRLKELEKLPSNTHTHHDGPGIRLDPAILRKSLDLQCVDVGGVERELVRVTLTRDPTLDRLALNYDTNNNSDEGFPTRLNFKNRRRRGSRASRRNDREDAMLVENITKEVFMSRLSLSPYHVGLRTRKSSLKRLETSTLRSESLDLWKQIQAERIVCQNPNSKRRLRVMIERDIVIDHLALQPVPQSLHLNGFEPSKDIDYAGLDQLAAECSSVPPRSPDLMCIRRSDAVLPVPPSQNKKEVQDKDVNSNVVIGQNSRSVQPRIDSQQIVRCRVAPECSLRHSDNELISFEPPAKCSQLPLHTRSSTSPLKIPENTAETKGKINGEASPKSTATARTMKLEEGKRNDTGLISNSEDPCDYPSTQAKTNPSIDIIKLKRITGNNWALLPSCPNAIVLVSSNPTRTASEPRSRTAFVKLYRHSDIDRLALEDSKSTACQPPSQLISGSTLPVSRKRSSVSGPESSKTARSRTNNEWPKLTVDAEIHHNENENPRKNSILPSRTIRKRFSIMGNFRKDNIYRKSVVRKNRLNSSEISNNSISQYVAVKKPLHLRSGFDSINIDPPNNTGS